MKLIRLLAAVAAGAATEAAWYARRHAGTA